MKKRILPLLYLLFTTLCHGEADSPLIVLFDKPESSHAGIQVAIQSYSEAGISIVFTDSLGRFDFPFEGGKTYRITASKLGYQQVVLDSVIKDCIRCNPQVISEKLYLYPEGYQVIDSLKWSQDFKKGETYVIRRPLIIENDITIEGGATIYFLTPAIIGKGIKVTANGTEKDSVHFYHDLYYYNYSPAFMMNKESELTLSYCAMNDIVIANNLTFEPKINASVTIKHCVITNTSKQRTYIPPYLTLSNTDLIFTNNTVIDFDNGFSIDSVEYFSIKDNYFINTGIGQIENTGNWIDQPKIEHNVFDLTKSKAEFLFVNLNNTQIRIENNQISYRDYLPLKIHLQKATTTYFSCNTIDAGIETFSNEVSPANFHNNLTHFYDNNFRLIANTTFSHTTLILSNNLFDLNNQLLTVNSNHAGCGCLEISAAMTRNTFHSGILWLNEQSDPFKLIGNIINTRLVNPKLPKYTSKNIIGKSYCPNCAVASPILDDESLAGYVSNYDPSHTLDVINWPNAFQKESNLLVDSEKMLNNIAPYYHGTSPFLQEIKVDDFSYDQLAHPSHFKYDYSIGYNPWGTCQENKHLDFVVPTTKDTCSISGKIYRQGKDVFGYDDATYVPVSVKVIATEVSTGKKRITTADSKGNYHFSYLSKGKYIIQAMLPIDEKWTEDYMPIFYFNKLSPSSANAVDIKGKVTQVDLLSPRLKKQSAPLHTIKGRIVYQDKNLNDNRMAERFQSIMWETRNNNIDNLAPIDYAAQYLSLVFRNRKGEPIAYSVTDKHGFYIVSLPIGAFTVEAQRVGFYLLYTPLENEINTQTLNGELVAEGFTTEYINGNTYQALPLALPNPFSNQLTIQTLPDNQTVYVYNAHSQLIYQGAAKDGLLTINTYDWAHGMYVVKTIDQTWKMIK